MTGDPPDCRPWFGGTAVTITTLGGGGFSGSRVFLVRTADDGRFVLKSFATTTRIERAAWIHGLMRHLRTAGVETVPDVVSIVPGHPPPDDTGCMTLAVDARGELWEVLEFIPGSPRPAPSASEAAAALVELARLHVAATTLPGSPLCTEPSPGMARRREQAVRMRASPWRALEQRAAACSHDAVLRRLHDAIDVFATCRGDQVIDHIAATDALPVVTQPVLRDVWSDHVLFSATGRVAGFIDFHAAGRDTPATDIARLLGSWGACAGLDVRSSGDPWRDGLAAYETVRPLSVRERNVIPWLHATGVICGLDNWFRWLITDDRRFDDMNRVLERIDWFVRHLPDALDTARMTHPGRD